MALAILFSISYEKIIHILCREIYATMEEAVEILDPPSLKLSLKQPIIHLSWMV